MKIKTKSELEDRRRRGAFETQCQFGCGTTIIVVPHVRTENAMVLEDRPGAEWVILEASGDRGERATYWGAGRGDYGFHRCQ